VVKEAVTDPLLDAADKGASNDRLQSMQEVPLQDGRIGNGIGNGNGNGSANPAKIKIEVTQDERDAFLSALLSGDRYVLPFKLFGSAMSGTFRVRSQAESKSIVAQLTRELRAGTVTLENDYGSRLRSMLLAAQVQELNGTTYTELAAPLMETVQADGQKQAPGWLAQVEVWERAPEGLVTALYEALKTFEQKYWTMVDSAKDQNFWKPAGSI
jgi:hypothetical protein